MTAARPMNDVLRENAARVIDTYAGWRGESRTKVAQLLFGDATYLYGVLGRPNADKSVSFRVRSYDVVIARFSEVWPASDLPWPAGVPRIWPAQVDEYPEFPKATYGKTADDEQPGEPAPAAADA